MLTEIIIYIALFAALFSGSFTAAFQSVEAMRYLQVQKNTVDDLYFLQSRLDSLIQSNPDWQTLSKNFVTQSVSGPELSIESFSSQIFETATSSNRVLFLTLGINKKIYTFSYVQEK
jgi:hypothetical protein